MKYNNCLFYGLLLMGVVASWKPFVQLSHNFKKAAITGSIVLFSFGTFDASYQIPAVADSSYRLSDVSFYEKFPYQKPTDILDFIEYRNPRIGEAQNILDLLDEFSSKYPMYKLSPLKARILSEEVKKKTPVTVLEIGTFFGYSAINVLENLPKQSKMVCIEADDQNTIVANNLISRAVGPAKFNQLRLINGISNVVIENGDLDSYHFDFIFLDHDKNSYLSDLKLLESRNLIDKGAIVVADNVLFPGAPGYLEYLEASGKYTTTLQKAPFERIGFETSWKEVPDAMSVSTYNME